MATFSALPPPAIFDIHERNAGEQWKDWKERWKCYTVATELDKKSKEVQVSVLLTVIGAEAHKVFNTFQLTEVQKKDPDAVLEAFGKYCEPISNTAFERYRFNLRGQRTGEPFDQYVTALRQLAQKCDFDNITPDQILRDRIMFGILDDKVRDRLLREKDLTLGRAMEICRASEVSAAQQEEVSRISQNSVHSVNKRKTQSATRGAVNSENNIGQDQDEWISDCMFCGREHKKVKEQCPAWGKTCLNCKRRNHFRNKCMLRKSGSRQGSRMVNFLDPEMQDDSDSQIFTVKTVSSVKLRDEQTVTTNKT